MYTFDQLKKITEKIYLELTTNDGGNVADYIPQLSRVDPTKFGISICDVNGNIFNIGDTTDEFCLQSASKPLSYCIARQISKTNIHNHVGYEPSGQSFNAFVLNKDNLPHNPMINAGAMMVASLIEPTKEPSERFETVKKFYSRLSGNKKVGYDNSVYLSEKHHADRNMSLAYYMRENKAYNNDNISPSELQDHLNLYFQLCSITINTEIGACIAASLSNGGNCPITNDTVIDNSITKDCLSLMYMCGMYDYSGQFAFKIGLPAKSGVSGCLLLVIPDVCGICIWSPKLDSMGNTVRGVEFCKLFTKYTKYNYHIFHSTDQNTTVEKVINACINNDINYIELALKNKFDINSGDYDKRTPLHLSIVNAEKNAFNLLKLLLNNGANLHAKDRWGNTPLDDLNNEIKQINKMVKSLAKNAGIIENNEVYKLKIYKRYKKYIINMK